MKPIAAAVCLLFATSLMQAQSAPATKPADPKAPAAKTAPAKATPGTAKPGAKKEELPKIPGAMITRANGTLLGLEVVGGNFKLTFYDKKHKPMAMDVTRAGRLRAAGYHVLAQTIPETITPKNRLLLGWL